MLRLSRLADYAVVVLLRLGAGAPVQTASGIALVTGIPEPTVAKVLKLLAAKDLVVSSRGARGGYRLGSPLEDVPVATVITAIDGPIALTACVEGAATACEVSGMCSVRGRWTRVNDAVRGALMGITLADLRGAPQPTSFAPQTRPAALGIAG